MMESDVLRSQAAANTKEQFMHSPALPDELMNPPVSDQLPPG